MDMVCKNCGAPAGKEQRVCPYCGAENEQLAALDQQAELQGIFARMARLLHLPQRAAHKSAHFFVRAGGWVAAVFLLGLSAALVFGAVGPKLELKNSSAHCSSWKSCMRQRTTRRCCSAWKNWTTATAPFMKNTISPPNCVTVCSTCVSLRRNGGLCGRLSGRSRPVGLRF